MGNIYSLRHVKYKHWRKFYRFNAIAMITKMKTTFEDKHTAVCFQILLKICLYENSKNRRQHRGCFRQESESCFLFFFRFFFFALFTHRMIRSFSFCHLFFAYHCWGKKTNDSRNFEKNERIFCFLNPS